jgi:hypothetical protein
VRALINLVMQYANSIQGNVAFAGPGQASATSHMHAFVSICKTKFTKMREMLSVLTSEGSGTAGSMRVLTPAEVLAVEALRVDFV